MASLLRMAACCEAFAECHARSGTEEEGFRISYSHKEPPRPPTIRFALACYARNNHGEIANASGWTQIHYCPWCGTNFQNMWGGL